MYDHGPSDHTEGALAVRYLSAEVSVGRGVESFPEEGEVECDDRIILDNQRCRWACRRERLVPRSRRQEVLKIRAGLGPGPASGTFPSVSIGFPAKPSHRGSAI